MTLKLHFNYKKKKQNPANEAFRRTTTIKFSTWCASAKVHRNAKKHNKHTGGVYLHNVQFVTVYFSKDKNTLVFSVFVSGVRALT